MAAQRLEKIESAPGNGMVSEASNPQDVVHGRADCARLRQTSRLSEKLQKKAPKVLQSLDAELKSALAFPASNDVRDFRTKSGEAEGDGQIGRVADDRRALLADAERQEGHHPAGGAGDAVQHRA